MCPPPLEAQPQCQLRGELLRRDVFRFCGPHCVAGPTLRLVSFSQGRPRSFLVLALQMRHVPPFGPSSGFARNASAIGSACAILPQGYGLAIWNVDDAAFEMRSANAASARNADTFLGRSPRTFTAPSDWIVSA